MDWMAISLGVLVASALIVYITRPWWPGRSLSQPDPAGPTLANRREALLAALRDLDFDYTVGKVTAEDYGPLRQALLSEVAKVMSQLDEQQAAAEASLEAEVLAVHRQLRVERSAYPAQSGRPCLTCGRVSNAGDLYCRGCGARLNGACPECGKAVQPTDHFCTSCGIELALALSG